MKAEGIALNSKQATALKHKTVAHVHQHMEHAEIGYRGDERPCVSGLRDSRDEWRRRGR